MASDLPRANLQPLSLYVPEPKFRPGDTVDFTQVTIPAAGEVRRPDTADRAESFIDLVKRERRERVRLRISFFADLARSLDKLCRRVVFCQQSV